MKSHNNHHLYSCLDALEENGVRVSFEHSNTNGCWRIALWLKGPHEGKPAWYRQRVGHIQSYQHLHDAQAAAVQLGMKYINCAKSED